MKLLVFAHTPPPHHGQSYMIQLMLDGFGGNHATGVNNEAPKSPANSTAAQHGIECYHVNARLSRDMEDIGRFRLGKLFHLIQCCLSTIRLRYRHGVTIFYYVPAPGKGAALLRDWIALTLCRPFFKRVIFHWHAAGLAEWLETRPRFPAAMLSRCLMKNADVSIVLSDFNRADAEKFSPKQIRVVHNGIPDPCADFETTVLPRRLARLEARTRLLSALPLAVEQAVAAGQEPHVFKVLFLAHCTREKGLFDTLDGVALANERLAHKSSPMRVNLTVAGNFVEAHERAEFEKRIARPDLRLAVTMSGANRAETAAASHVGFASGEVKWRLFAESDCFCFPTFYRNENQPVNLVEAMAFGLPTIASDWRSIPEMLPAEHAILVPPRSPQRIADSILALLSAAPFEPLRDHFLENFTIEQHLAVLAAAIHSIEPESRLHSSVQIKPVVN